MTINKLVLVLFMILGYMHNTTSQESRFNLEVGYEALFINKKLTNGVAQRHFIWKNNETGDEYLTFRTSTTHAYTLGMNYDIYQWMRLSLGFKKYYRRYYIWSGTYIGEDKRNSNFNLGQFDIAPYGSTLFPSMFLGTTLSVNSLQFGVTFNHSISKDHRWRLHYHISANRDLYETPHSRFDTNIDYASIGSYQFNEESERVSYETEAYIIPRTDNPGTSPFNLSTNLGIGIGRKTNIGNEFILEIGLRNIRFLKDNQYLEENHFEMQLRHREYIVDQRTGEISEHLLVEDQHNFPLDIGGIYINLIYNFYPFKVREKKDKSKKQKGFLNFLRR